MTYYNSMRSIFYPICVEKNGHGEQACFEYRLYLANPETVKIIHQRVFKYNNCQSIEYGRSPEVVECNIRRINLT